MLELLVILFLLAFLFIVGVGFFLGGFISYILLKRIGRENTFLIVVGSFFWGLAVTGAIVGAGATFIFFTGFIGFCFLAVPPAYYYFFSDQHTLQHLRNQKSSNTIKSDDQTFLPQTCYYSCRKCGRRYTQEEINKNRFCTNCGTFLYKPLFRSGLRDDGYPEDWNILREKALKRAGYRCEKCGSKRKLHVHHIVPRSQGGSDDLSNLMVLCAKCHAAEHPDNIWLEIMAYDDD